MKKRTAKPAAPAEKKETVSGKPEVTIYVVAAKAPPFVAGRRVAPGQELELTAEQALYERQAGHILAKEGPHDGAPLQGGEEK